jgi:EF hand
VSSSIQNARFPATGSVSGAQSATQGGGRPADRARKSEATAARAIEHFVQQLDTNGDGQISMEELLAGLMKMLKPTGQSAGGGDESSSGGGSATPSVGGAGGGGSSSGGASPTSSLMSASSLADALLSGLGLQGNSPAAPPPPDAGSGGGGGGAGTPAPGPASAAPAPSPTAAPPAPPAPSGSSSGPAAETGAPSGVEGGPSGTDGKPKVKSFDTINPGEGPEKTIGKDGKFVFKRVVDDSFLPPDVKAGMHKAVKDNMKNLDFFKDHFRNEGDAYQYMVQMANLESARGTTLANKADAQGTGNGSSGYMHLHDKFGYEKEQWGRPLNTEGWSKDEALGDYSKYSTLVMRSLDANYHKAGADKSAEAAQKTMSMWWVGNDKTEAGKYYLSALSNGSGVNHNTGSTFA